MKPREGGSTGLAVMGGDVGARVGVGRGFVGGIVLGGVGFGDGADELNTKLGAIGDVGARVTDGKFGAEASSEPMVPLPILTLLPPV
jgi:hypothetical protein